MEVGEELILQIIIIILLLILIAVVILRTGGQHRKHFMESFGAALKDEIVREQTRALDETEDSLTDRISLNVAEIRQDINQRLYLDSEENRKNRTEVAESISRGQEKLDHVLRESLLQMEESNQKKLSEIQGEINRRLDVSLNERLDASFKTVGDQLNRLYESLGELSKLESGVSSLNRTLANVKTRGIYGEMQLENILNDTLSPSLFDKNVVTKKSVAANRDAVEFAVKIPDKEIGGTYLYLPIDSKYPSAAYERILEAADQADAAGVSQAVKELEQRVRSDAKDIRDKYLDPPNTTDFGIMFLPTESLYAEVLRIPGLMEDCRARYHVVITGPTTAAALLNSLSIGFRYMAVNKDSKNILKLLSAIKTQYQMLSELIETTDSRLELAKKATAELQHRTDLINKRLASVEEIDPIEAQSLLGTGKD